MTVASDQVVKITLEGQSGHNFESLFVDPLDASKLYLISKNPYNLTAEEQEAYRVKVFMAENPVETNSEPIALTEIG